jgi:hypothetical protein
MTESIKFGDKDYALVPGRLKKFREENPRASVDTEPSYNNDGSVTFKATIIRDQAEPHSARATGNARYTEVEMKKPKSFEKLETISVGRALANLGYLNDGRIATSEEMEEFEKYKSDREREAVEEGVDKLLKAKDIDSLKSAFVELGNLMTHPEIVKAKDKRKAELSEDNKG